MPRETRTENRVHLETLIRQFENAGFRVGLTIKRDGFTRHLWFKGGHNDYLDFPLAPTTQSNAEHDAERIWNEHLEVLNP